MSNKNEKTGDKMGSLDGRLRDLPERSNARFTPDTNMALPVRLDEKRRAIMYPEHGNKCGFYLTESPVSMIEVKREDGTIFNEVQNNAPIGSLEYSVRKDTPNLGFLWFSNNENLEREFDVSYNGMGMITHVQNLVPPIGFVYVEYPTDLAAFERGMGPLAPEYMWPGTEWHELDYGGIMFRSQGGGASLFGNGVQPASLPNIEGNTGLIGAVVGGIRTSFRILNVFNYAMNAFYTIDTNPSVYDYYPSPSSVVQDQTTNRASSLYFSANNFNPVYGRRSYMKGGVLTPDFMPENQTVKHWLRVH
jgi:hypothetical protein